MKKGSDRSTVSTGCNTCGNCYDTYYDTEQDYYICGDCIAKEDDESEEDEEELEDHYPCDLTASEFYKMKEGY